MKKLVLGKVRYFTIFGMFYINLFSLLYLAGVTKDFSAWWYAYGFMSMAILYIWTEYGIIKGYLFKG